MKMGINLSMIKSNHPLQAPEWEEFRKKTGIKVIKIDNLQMTLHKIPHTSWKIGYIPKGTIPTKEMILKLTEVGKNENCIFIQLEPNEMANGPLRSEASKWKMENLGLKPAAHPLFTKYTF